MKIIFTVLIFFILQCTLYSQFDIEKYKEYLKNRKDMTPEELLKEYPAGKFLKYAPVDFNKAEYGDSIDRKYQLTPYEKSLIGNHGFMVTERLNFINFAKAMNDIYHRDLPLYISADAILHSLHFSMDKMLEEAEKFHLSESLKSMLQKMKLQIEVMGKLDSGSTYLQALKDFDLYVYVGSRLLTGESLTPVYEMNKQKADAIIQMIKSQSLVLGAKIFTDCGVDIDFSQFKPRGHYTSTNELTQYFQSMMWLGKIEIFIDSPVSLKGELPKEDLLRNRMLTAVIAEATLNTAIQKPYTDIDNFLNVFIGRQDNITVAEVCSVMKKNGVAHAFELSDAGKIATFVNDLKELNSANQLYNSQVLFQGSDQVKPAAAFMLMGQRPILDGFTTANVVYDKIIYQEDYVRRMLPKTLDIIFAFGNDAAAQLLLPELNRFHYSPNLAGLRYLINSYDEDFWKSTTYSSWWKAIRNLNPPLDRTGLPLFMQTAAWQQKTMNTQLASWAELRHDFLLYAKQPSTSGLLCSFPHSYVEPVPELYRSVKLVIQSANEALKLIDADNYSSSYCDKASKILDSLYNISVKELKGVALSKNETDFLEKTFAFNTFTNGCDHNNPNYTLAGGWYLNLYYSYNNNFSSGHYAKDAFVVADVHTAPTDEDGNITGNVLHAGTGSVNLCVIVARTPEGTNRAYIGPVSSYYEYTSSNFIRLSDEEWSESIYTIGAVKPEFTRLYLAEKNQTEPLEGISLLMEEINDVHDGRPSANLSLAVTPNPFPNRTVISFTVPAELTGENVSISFFDIMGAEKFVLLNKEMQSGNYCIEWDGSTADRQGLTPGVYLCRLKIGNHEKTVKLIRN